MKTKLLVVVCILCIASNVMAAGTWWQGPAGGNWMDAANWGSGIPSGAVIGVVSYYNGYDPMVVVNSTTTACDNVRISDNTNGMATVNVNSGGTLQVSNSMILGYTAGNIGSRINLSGGTIRMSGLAAQLYVGQKSISVLSQFEMSAGNLTLNMASGSTSKITIGDGYGGGATPGSGLFNLSGGTVKASTISVGRLGAGTLNVSNSGFINTKDILIGEGSSHPVCILNMTGGQIDASSTISIGYGGESSNDSILNISAGELDAKNIIVARNGKGKMIIDGSAATIAAENLWIGGYNGAVAQATVEFKVGANGVSAIEVSDTVNFDLGNAASTAELLVALTAAPAFENIVLVDNQSTNDVIGVFDLVNGGSAIEGASLVLSFGGIDYNYTLTYQGIAGTDGIANDIMLVIPEPATISILALGSMFFALRRRQ